VKPTSLTDITGLRAARWTRESTAGQFDAFGADAQREQQDRAIERYGLIDTGLSWSVAHSGRTIGTTAQFAEMMAAAGTAFDILVVGYVSRFARDLRTAVNARHDLHAAGAAILFADERLLSTDEEAWEQWAREAVEAESYSRRLARRVREGYAAKRRRLGEPGGRPPFGFIRTGKPPILHPDADAIGLVKTAFELACQRRTDHQIAAELGLTVHIVRSILTNPIYTGYLRDGASASVQPVIDPTTFEQAQAVRASRARKGDGSRAIRVYALPMIRCAGCGRRLVGDTGRYRHLQPCDTFVGARRRSAFRHRLVRSGGHSYPATLYENVIPAVLDKAALTADELADAAALYGEVQLPVDEVGLRRIARERVAAAERFSVDRDVDRLQQRMDELDDEERRLRTPATSRPDWKQVLAVLRDLPAMWREADQADRRRMAVELFDSINVTGARAMTIDFTTGIRGEVVMMDRVGAKGSTAPPSINIILPWGAKAVG